MDNMMDMDSNQGILSSTLNQSNFQNKEKGISNKEKTLDILSVAIKEKHQAKMPLFYTDPTNIWSLDFSPGNVDFEDSQCSDTNNGFKAKGCFLKTK